MNSVTVLLVALFVTNTYAANGGNCQIRDDSIDWINNVYDNPDIILDTDSSFEKIFEFDGELVVDSSNSDYLTVTASDGQLIFAANGNFENIDNDTPKQIRDTATIIANVNLRCQDGITNLIFRQQVRDTNNHAPTFSSPEGYVYNVPMPMLQRIDYTTLGADILATDIDFSNQAVTYTLEPPGDFVLAATPTSGSKEYKATLTVSRTTRIAQDTTYILTATDSGNPARSTTTNLEIRIDRDASLTDVPLFSASSYALDYAVVDGNPVLTPRGDNIKIVADDPSQITLAVSGVNPDIFETKVDDSTGEVTIGLNELIPSTTSHVIVLTLSATLGDASEGGETIVLIYVPDDIVVTVPKFSAPYYTAKYSTETDPNTVVLDSPISVTDNAEQVSVVLAGGYIDYFEVTQDSGNNYQIGVKKNLEDEVISSNSEIILTLQVTVDGATDDGFATLIISLPQNSLTAIPTFSEVYYTAEYVVQTSGNDRVQVTNGPIVIDAANFQDISVILTGDLADNFEVQGPEDGAYTLNLKTNLDDTILNNNAEVVVVLEATFAGVAGRTTASVVVTLPGDGGAVAVPKFSSILYTAQYDVVTDGTDTVTLTGVDQIAINGDDVGVTTIVVSDPYRDNFKVEFNADDQIFVISVTENLDSDVLSENQEIVLTLDASIDGNNEHGQANLFLKLPIETTDIAPKFTNTLYTAEYSVVTDGTDTVTLTGEDIINIDGDDSGTTNIVVSDPYQDNFKVDFDDNNKVYLITVIENLDNDILNGNQEIILKLDASVEGNNEHGFANLLLKLPEKPSDTIPKFSHPYYTANYAPVDSGTDSVELSGDAIEITSDQADITQVTVTGTFANNFNAVYEDNSWKIIVTNNLGDDILNRQKEVVAILEASLDGSSESATATLIVKLPDTELAAAPVFTQIFYTAKYSTDTDDAPSIVMTSDPIAIADSNEAEVEVQLRGIYKDNFILERDTDNKQWNLRINEPLEDSVIEQETEIIFELDGILDGAISNGFATLLVKLPLQPAETIKFDNTFYTATYTVNDGTDTVTSDEITVSDSSADISVVGDYSANFDVICDDSHVCRLTVKQNLPDDVLSSETDLIIALEASKTDVPDKGTATVIITLPLKDIPAAPQFTQDGVYTATYSTDEILDKVIVDNGPITIIEKSDFSKVSATLSGTNHEHFSLLRDDINGYWQLSVLSDLPEDVLETSNAVVLTLNAVLDGYSRLGTATLVIKLPRQFVSTEIYFSDVVYLSKYVENKDSATLTVEDEIRVEGTSLDQVEVNAVGEYGKYFGTDYDGDTGKVSLTLTEELPRDLVNNSAVITINIEANIKNTEPKVLAGLVVKLPLAQNNGGNNDGNGSGDDDDDDNGGLSNHVKIIYISVIVVLSILLVGFIIGSAAFYYFKIRNRNNYAEMDDYMNSEKRFTRNPKVSETKKFDHPTRRATGIVRYSLNDEGGPQETTTDNEERRKSVQFDEDVEKREIEPKDNDSDEDEDPTTAGGHREQRTEL